MTAIFSICSKFSITLPPLQLTNQILDFATKRCGCIVVTHDNHHRIVAGQAAHHLVHTHGVDGRTGCGGKTRQRADNDDILGIVHAGDALFKDGEEETLARWPNSGYATITGVKIYGSPTLNLDGVSIQTSGGSEVIGINNTAGATITGLPAGVSGAKISVEDVNNAFAELSDDSFKNQYNEVLAQYNSIVNDASYKGVNLLKDGSLDVKFSDSSSSSLQIKGQDISTSNIGLNAAEWKSHNDINNSLSELRAAIRNLRSFSSELGNNYSIVQNREDFTKSLINVLTEGADKLTLADMNEESANMLALQTRQQLAINALSLASQASQSVLKLF